MLNRILSKINTHSEVTDTLIKQFAQQVSCAEQQSVLVELGLPS
jgi:hypothetical protein